MTHHKKKHPNVAGDEFHYDSKAKAKKLGYYSNFSGFNCCLCKRSVQDIKKHFRNMHKDIDMESDLFKNYLSRSSLNNSLQVCLDAYFHMLTSSGVAKRNRVPSATATTYVKQVSHLLTSFEDLSFPDKIYNNLEKVEGTGAESTKYAYLATLQNFLCFMELSFADVHPEAIVSLRKNVDHWLKRQRKKKEKRHNFYKEKTRRKLNGLPLPAKAIQSYENVFADDIKKLQQANKLKKKSVETLYSDIFLKVICKLGCRPGVLTGCTQKELKDAEKTSAGNYSVLVEKQKEKQRHSCIVITQKEMQDLEIASKHAYAFLKKNATDKDPVLPSLLQTDDLHMKSPEFSKIFGQRVALVFKKRISATDVRKIITTKMRHQPVDIQTAVAQAEGHSVQVAHSFYNISHPHEVVERARTAMMELAEKGISVLRK